MPLRDRTGPWGTGALGFGRGGCNEWGLGKDWVFTLAMACTIALVLLAAFPQFKKP